MTRSEKLQEGYYNLRLKKNSPALNKDGQVFESVPWQTVCKTEVRKKDGWELRVYEIEGDIEACIIDPHGKSKTYS